MPASSSGDRAAFEALSTDCVPPKAAVLKGLYVWTLEDSEQGRRPYEGRLEVARLKAGEGVVGPKAALQWGVSQRQKRMWKGTSPAIVVTSRQPRLSACTRSGSERRIFKEPIPISFPLAPEAWATAVCWKGVPKPAPSPEKKRAEQKCPVWLLSGPVAQLTRRRPGEAQPLLSYSPRSWAGKDTGPLFLVMDMVGVDRSGRRLRLQGAGEVALGLPQ